MGKVRSGALSVSGVREAAGAVLCCGGEGCRCCYWKKGGVEGRGVRRAGGLGNGLNKYACNGEGRARIC